MVVLFAPFKLKCATTGMGTTFFLESDNTPEGMPNKMFGTNDLAAAGADPGGVFAHSDEQ